MICLALETAQLQFIEADSTLEADKILAHKFPDLILLDWMLPGMSGIDYARKLKKQTVTQHIPIIMLTAKAEEENKIKGLETGADDYITKPFSPRELIARIKTVLRRGALVAPDGFITIQDLCLDDNHKKVVCQNETILLTVLEYDLLRFLVTQVNRICTREQLLDQVWGREADVDLRTVDVQIRRLRDKLKKYGYDKLIKTSRGVGYEFSTK